MPPLATTIALTMGLTKVKEAWAAGTGDAKEHLNVVRMCCAIKPYASWHLGHVVTTARERCGGQGYLSASRIGTYFGSAHAGQTAEGDNSVLMQKVAKEHLGLFKPHKDTPPTNLDLENVDHIEYLLKARENMQYDTLKKKLAPAMVYTKVGKSMPDILKPIGDKLQEKGIFNTWMLQEQDLIQAFAKSYADRIVCEAFKETLAGSYGTVDPSLVPVLNKVRLSKCGPACTYSHYSPGAAPAPALNPGAGPVHLPQLRPPLPRPGGHRPQSQPRSLRPTRAQRSSTH